MVDDKTKTVLTLFILGIVFFFFGGQIIDFMTDGGIVGFLAVTLGTVLTTILGGIFMFFGVVALFIDIKSYQSFMIGLGIALTILIIGLFTPIPFDEGLSLVALIWGMNNSTKPKNKQIANKLGL